MTQVFDEQQIAMLDAPLDQRLISTRSGGGNSSLKYIEGHDAIDQADRIFGYGNWAYRPLSCEQTILIDPVDGTPVGVTYKAQVELVVAGAIAPIVEVGSQPVVSWNVLDTIMSKRKREDQDRPIQKWEEVNARRTIVDAHEMAEKGSVTDALKRCLRTYGNQFGNGLYGDGRVDLDEPQPQQRQQSAPRTQQQSAKAAPQSQSQDDEMPATEQQINAIQRLSASLDREMPADMDKLTLFGAKKLISLLTADIRERKATQSNQNGTQTVASGQPEVQNAVPSQNDSQPSQTQSKPSEIDAVRSRWFKAYHIKDDDQIDIRWKAFKLSLFNGSIEDAALRQSHITRINDTVGAHERKQQRSY
jgi:recombination DNA repair RAD52 pathway protein